MYYDDVHYAIFQNVEVHNPCVRPISQHKENVYILITFSLLFTLIRDKLNFIMSIMSSSSTVKFTAHGPEFQSIKAESTVRGG